MLITSEPPPEPRNLTLEVFKCMHVWFVHVCQVCAVHSLDSVLNDLGPVTWIGAVNSMCILKGAGPTGPAPGGGSGRQGGGSSRGPAQCCTASCNLTKFGGLQSPQSSVCVCWDHVLSLSLGL